MVISSRLVSLGSGPSALPVFESRLKLVEVPHTSEHLLARLLARVAADELRGEWRMSTGERWLGGSDVIRTAVIGARV
jgi:hypothetical protein